MFNRINQKYNEMLAYANESYFVAKEKAKKLYDSAASMGNQAGAYADEIASTAKKLYNKVDTTPLTTSYHFVAKKAGEAGASIKSIYRNNLVPIASTASDLYSIATNAATIKEVVDTVQPLLKPVKFISGILAFAFTAMFLAASFLINLFTAKGYDKKPLASSQDSMHMAMSASSNSSSSSSSFERKPEPVATAKPALVEVNVSKNVNALFAEQPLPQQDMAAAQHNTLLPTMKQ